jgi:hypothetical protein
MAFKKPGNRSTSLEEKSRVIADPALSVLKASFVSRHHPVQ